jgi:hypothetical protein
MESTDLPPRGPGRPPNNPRRVAELMSDREAGQAAEDNPIVRSGDHVVVMSKLALPLTLHLDEMVDWEEPHPGGTRTRKRAQPLGEKYVINGNATIRGGEQEARNIQMYSGYAMTPGIPADFWEKWVEQNRGSDLVKNRIVFAMPTQDRARGKARELREVVSGTEPLDPNKPQLVDRRIQPGNTTVDR